MDEPVQVDPVRDEYQRQLRLLAAKEAQVALRIFQLDSEITHLTRQAEERKTAVTEERRELDQVRGALALVQGRLEELRMQAAEEAVRADERRKPGEADGT